MSKGKMVRINTNQRYSSLGALAPPGTGSFMKSEGGGAPRLLVNATAHWAPIPVTKVRSDEMTGGTRSGLRKGVGCETAAFTWYYFGLERPEKLSRKREARTR